MVIPQLLQILHTHPIWGDTFFYLFISALLVSFITVLAIMMKIMAKNKEIKSLQQQYIAKIDGLRKDHFDMSDKMRIEMLKKEEERSRQWHESEKETLHVLNGVSMLLDLNNKIERTESEKILLKLDEIQNKVEKLTK